MKNLLGFALIWVAFSSYLTVSAIQCFECVDCRVPFRDDDESYRRICDGASCMRTNITFKHNTIVSRGCTHTRVPLERCDRKAVAGTYIETCYCNNDDCNTGSYVIMTFTAASLSAIVLTFYSFFMKHLLN